MHPDNTSRKNTFDDRISPRLTENRIKKKHGDIFKIKCNNTTAIGVRTAIVKYTNIRTNYYREISPRLFPEPQ